MNIWWRRAGLYALAVAAAASCGGGQVVTGAGGASRACVPGAQSACACPAGEPAGVQVCDATGAALGPCACVGTSSSSSSSGSASSSGSSSSSSTGGGTGGSTADAGPLSPDQIPGLSLWLDSSKGTTLNPQNPQGLQVWADQTSHGNNATQPSASNEAALLLSGYKSFNVVEFDAGGESRYMSVGDDASLQFSTGGFAIAMVLYAAPQNTTTIYAKDPVNGLVISVDNNVNVVTPTAAAHAYMTQDAWHVVLVRGPALEVRIDGVTTTGTTSTSDLSAVGTSISLGPTAGSPLMATIEYLQFLVYQGGMSDAQAAGLESYLATKYGL